MIFAPTLPAALYPVLDDGMCHLVQAHHLAQGPGDAMDWFRARRHGTGHVVILDNGVIELGEPDIDLLLEMTDAIKPSAVICPDSFQDYDGTLELFYEYAPILADKVPTVVVVPHGESVHQWCMCTDEMVTHLRDQGTRCVVGVPKVLSTYEGGRWSALGYLSEYHQDVSIHLLGMWYGLDEAMECAGWYPNVMSIDSTLPYAHALQGRLTVIWPDTKAKLSSEDFNVELEDIDEETIWLAKMNISAIKRLLEPSVRVVPLSVRTPLWVTDQGHQNPGP